MIGIKINKTLRNFIIGVLAIILIFVVKSLFPDKDFHEKYEGYNLSASSGSSSDVRTYSEYQEIHSAAAKPSVSVALDVFAYDRGSSYGISEKYAYYGRDVVVTEDRSSVTWPVDVPESGFYNIEMEYVAVPSRNINMERILYINGEIPFSGADILSFSRLWKDGGPVKYDNQGNSIRPSQVEFYAPQTVRFKSDLGYEVDPYCFYFSSGRNTVTLESTNEPMAVSSIRLVPVRKYNSYEQYVSAQPSSPDSYKGGGVSVKIQGEDAAARSDPSLFARYDRSSAITEPYSVTHTVLNYAGGESWKSSGQWIEWNFEVPDDGWYTVSFQARQLYQRGYVASRTIYIDGEIPVDSVKNVGFPFSSDWKLTTLSGDDGVPYRFYLSKGAHTLRMEATLGEIGSIISDLQDSIFRLNKIYRTILVLTGNYPDQFRDYEIDKVYPEEVDAMLLESRRLYRSVDRFVSVMGQKSDKIAMAETLAVQLENFYKNPDRITKGFQNFKDNITSLGSSLLSMAETKLDVDYILIQSAGDKIRPVKAGFFRKARHEIVSFLTSFFVDSTKLGNVYGKDAEHTIEVWIVTGRDQSTILKNMIDDSFTPESGVNVNVKLIALDSLLNAVVAGNGPDVVISVDSARPVDYALRNANVDLMRFSDCEDVLKQFKPSAYEAYRYSGGIYALPETQTFNLLFYRKDILKQLELEIPQTWDDLIAILPTLQGNNLTVGIPYPSIQAPDMTTFYSMVYQRGGSVYNDRGTKTLIDSEAGIASFKEYTSFYNSYGLPSVFDFLNRFRSGEMPIGVANYQTYNTLVVSAPEIRGQWDFTYLPGTERTGPDGKTYIDRSSVSGGTCVMMIKKGMDSSDIDIGADYSSVSYSSIVGRDMSGLAPGIDAETLRKVVKNENRMRDSWEFMKWWVSSDTQVRFGREIEALLGSSSRYATANVEAFRQLPWSSRQMEVLLNSLDETVGLPEVPGSYFTPRHIVNGTRKVINEKEDPRETLIDYARKINEELTRKRQEFALPTE